MIESKLRQALVRNLSKLGVHVQPIESGGTARGIPDVNMALRHCGEIWVELKRNKAKPSNYQRNWADARVAAGGTVWMLQSDSEELRIWSAPWGISLHPDYIMKFPLNYRGLVEILFHA